MRRSHRHTPGGHHYVQAYRITLHLYTKSRSFVKTDSDVEILPFRTHWLMCKLSCCIGQLSGHVHACPRDLYLSCFIYTLEDQQYQEFLCSSYSFNFYYTLPNAQSAWQTNRGKMMYVKKSSVAVSTRILAIGRLKSWCEICLWDVPSRAHGTSITSVIHHRRHKVHDKKIAEKWCAQKNPQ